MGYDFPHQKKIQKSNHYQIDVLDNHGRFLNVFLNKKKHIKWVMIFPHKKMKNLITIKSMC